MASCEVICGTTPTYYSSTTMYSVLQSTTPVLLLYYKVLLQYYSVLQSTTPVLLCTTQYYNVRLCTTKYYNVLLQYYSVLQRTTPVLLCTTKYYSCTTLYYKVLRQYYNVVTTSRNHSRKRRNCEKQEKTKLRRNHHPVTIPHKKKLRETGENKASP